MTAMQVINRIKDEFQRDEPAKNINELLNGKSNKDSRKVTKPLKKNKNNSGVSIAGMDDIEVTIAQCCKPLPGDPITGYITRGRGIKIHHSQCPNLKNYESDRLVEAQWQLDTDQIFSVQLLVVALDRPKITPEVMALINDAKVHITAITSRVKNDQTFMDMDIEVNDLNQLNIMLDKIKSIQDVLEVKRTISHQ